MSDNTRLLKYERTSDSRLHDTPSYIKDNYVPHVWVTPDDFPAKNILDRYPILSYDTELILCHSRSPLSQRLVLENIEDGSELDSRILFLDIEAESLGIPLTEDTVAMVNILVKQWRGFPEGSLVLMLIHEGKVYRYISTSSEKLAKT